MVSTHMENVMFLLISQTLLCSFPLNKPHNCRCVLTQKIHGSAVLSSGRGELTSHLHPTLKWPLGLYGSIVNGLYLHELLTVLMFPLYWPPYPFSTLSIPMGMWANVSTFLHICSTLSHNVNRKCWIKHLPLANIWGKKNKLVSFSVKRAEFAASCLDSVLWIRWDMTSARKKCHLCMSFMVKILVNQWWSTTLQFKLQEGLTFRDTLRCKILKRTWIYNIIFHGK